jgi:hypothetical protein
MSHFDSCVESMLMFYSISDIERECYLIIQSLIRSICESVTRCRLSGVQCLTLVNVPFDSGIGDQCYSLRTEIEAFVSACPP